ncbi:MAG: Rid family hydrolase, partial [Planctomycetota bacterium]
VLAAHGASLLDGLLRTWVFVRDIDNHYAHMVAARRDLFRDAGLTPATRFVASTGIEGASHAPGALVSLDALAVVGLRREQIIRIEARDHLNPTSEYQVTFERGTKVLYDDRSHIFISGTASIDHRGQILHPGDVVKQTHRTLENIECLLQNAGARFDDLTMMIVYLRDAADAAVVEQRLSEFLTRPVPRVMVHAPVCRPGWLVEIECMAARPAERGALPRYG